MIRDVFEFAAGEIVQGLADSAVYNGVEGIPVVWGSDFQAVQSGDLRLSSRRPEVYVRYIDMPVDPDTEELTEPTEGDLLTVRDLNYRAVTVRPDLEDVGCYLTLKREG